MKKLATISAGTIGALCLATTALANQVILSNNSSKPVKVQYHVVYRDNQNTNHLGSRRVITLNAHQQRKITFHLGKKQYAGLALTQILAYGDEKFNMPEMQQKFGSEKSCTVATNHSHPNGILHFQVTEQDKKHQLQCEHEQGAIISS